MSSIASSHFPQYVFRDHHKKLWNPVLKKTYTDLPEERVRLQVLDYLIYEAGFPSSRISFESPVDLPKDKSASRTDVICYDKDFKPLLLIECKAPEIRITEKTALQIGRYNTEVGAPFLLITNGINDFWFEIDPEKNIKSSNIPDFLKPKLTLQKDLQYWSQRSFIGKKSHPDIRKWLIENCEQLYDESSQKGVSYLKFEGSPEEFYMPGFYRVFSDEEEYKLALAFNATPFGATRLNGVLNKKGENIALCSVALDLAAKGESVNMNIQSGKGSKTADIKKVTGFNFENPVTILIPKLMDYLIRTVD